MTLHRKTGKIEHNGIKIEFIGQIELYYDRGNHHEFLSLVIFQEEIFRILESFPILGSAGGAGLLLFMIGFVSYCIVINLHDKAEYDRHMREMDDLWAQGDIKESSIMGGKSKSVRFKK